MASRTTALCGFLRRAAARFSVSAVCSSKVKVIFTILGPYYHTAWLLDRFAFCRVSIKSVRLVLGMRSNQRVRVVTYNVHKCRGLDRRVRPGRIIDILGRIDADIIALQEVCSIEGRSREEDQARFIAEELGLGFAFGENWRFKGGRYGNVVLTRFPIQIHRNYDITTMNRQPRGCLRTDVKLGASTLHVFNVHFGTALLEHRAQAHRLFDD